MWARNVTPTTVVKTIGMRARKAMKPTRMPAAKTMAASTLSVVVSRSLNVSR